MSAATSVFIRLVTTAMGARGVGLREACRLAEIDPSLLSKMLSGKRPPPSDEEVLSRLAAALKLDPIELTVAAGLIPRSWSALLTEPALLKTVHAMATKSPPVPRPRAAIEMGSAARRPSITPVLGSKPLSEELL